MTCGQEYLRRLEKKLEERKLFTKRVDRNLLLMLILVGFITYAIVWIWGMIDAYKVVEKN